jgi:hypothetical protein
MRRRLPGARAGAGTAAISQTPQALVIAAWACVVIPLAWGVWITLQKVMVLFH